VVQSLDDDEKQAAAEVCRQHMAGDVRELIAVAKGIEMRQAAGEPPDDLSRKRFSDAREHLLEVARLGMTHGLSRLEVQLTIAAAARGEAATEVVRLALYEVIEEIGSD
jgi:hypothetical protein